ncbi:hypothetical protein [Sphingomonas dokdonensis]|uniref:Uncharacterized protein n=1 Tax=Sphingomonas dokdonensis TaxID=344880 RepID=A0A245ZNH6_9SPHN|nr:hypothetical protein [Sphingomonas dokdonensis]OWK31308.1 hypothetical protein SPDO_13150 [Sphingomonas dokdonensis]
MAVLAHTTGAPKRASILDAVLARFDAAAGAPDDSWEELHARWLVARDAAKAAERHYLTTVDGTPACDRAGRTRDATFEWMNAIEGRMLATPAPHQRALLWKIEYALRNDEDEGSTIAWSFEHIAPIVADARRMLGEARS